MSYDVYIVMLTDGIVYFNEFWNDGDKGDMFYAVFGLEFAP